LVAQARSQLFCRLFAATAGSSAPFVIPDGYTGLLKSAVYHNYGSAPAVCVIIVGIQATGQTMYMAETSVPSNLTDYVELWTVLQPGDAISAYTTAGSVNIAVSGALLTGAPLFPAVEGSTIEPFTLPFPI
jgi:hypothetical protein